MYLEAKPQRISNYEQWVSTYSPSSLQLMIHMEHGTFLHNVGSFPYPLVSFVLFHHYTGNWPPRAKRRRLTCIVFVINDISNNAIFCLKYTCTYTYVIKNANVYGEIVFIKTLVHTN